MPRFTGVERLIYSAWNYWFVFVCDLLAPVAFLILGSRLFNGSLLRASLFVMGGFLSWSWIEYAVHRWVLHGPSSLLTRAHARHHADGTALIGAPALMSIVLALAVWAVLSIPLTAGSAALAVSGLYAGYSWYMVLHHLQHRQRERLARVPHLAGLEEAHRIHHRKFVVNYGVSTTLWDHVLGSYQASADTPRVRRDRPASTSHRQTTAGL